MRIKCVICYDGNHLNGWHGSKGVFIESLLEDAFFKIHKNKTQFFCSGRTDAGVHALGQVIHFDYSGSLGLKKLLMAMNHYLPSFIKIINMEQVEEDFHARFDTKFRTYFYQFYISLVLIPFLKNHSLQIYSPISIEKIQQFLPKLQGVFDFKTFCSGDYKKPTVKSIEKCYLETTESYGVENFRVFFKAKSFGHHQIRNLMGGILNIGYGRWSEEQFWEALEKKNRFFGPAMAPAHGLYFVKSTY